MAKSSTVIVETLEAKQGSIGVLTLNSEKTLNSLTLDMVQALTAALQSWASNEEVALVLLKGAGHKAFCAGGDVQKLYESSMSVTEGPRQYAETFFCEEYQLNYLIHTFPKPIICIGNGIVMGGGLGLMAGASHRVVNESTRIAMPEITIGLFPDVGGTWFLNKMPDALGIFFALTGASLNAHDALLVGLGDYFLESDAIEKLIEALTQTKWHSDVLKNHTALNALLAKQALSKKTYQSKYPSQLSPHILEISKACHETSLGEVIHALTHLNLESDWFNKSLKSLAQGSPLSSLLIFEQLRRHRFSDLETVFKSELLLATNIVRHTEFAEGVRALLIDKDKNPKWQHTHFSQVENSLLESFFNPPWQENPLDLGE